jgi:hypothetical protein
MGLRSVQPAVITSKANTEAFAIVIPYSFVKSRLNDSGRSRTPVLPHSGLCAYCTELAAIDGKFADDSNRIGLHPANSGPWLL